MAILSKERDQYKTLSESPKRPNHKKTSSVNVNKSRQTNEN
jgi:hypothetical protein